MRILGVWLDYQPTLYQDLLKRCLELMSPAGSIHVVEANRREDLTGETDPESIDVVLLSLDDQGTPSPRCLPGDHPGALWLAFSPRGNLGLKRLPDRVDWESICPFGIKELAAEIGSLNKGR